jgi:hypothetical protein
MRTDLAGVERNEVFGRSVRDGIILGAVTGAASGTAAAPVLGTILGAAVGFTLAVPIALIAAAVIARGVHPSGTVRAFRRRVDVTFAVLAAGTAALAVGWISLEALVGAAPAVTMLVTVVVGLAIIRPRLLRLVATPTR